MRTSRRSGNRILERDQALPDVESVGAGQSPAARRRRADRGRSSSKGIDAKAAGLGNVDYRSVTPDYFRTLGDSAACRPRVHRRRSTRRRRRWRSSTSGSRSRVRRRRSGRPARPHSGRATALGDDRRRRRPHPPRSARRGRAAADLLSRSSSATQDRMALVVRTRTDPAAIGAVARRAIRAVDPEQPVYDARTLEAVVDRSLAQRWLQTALLGAFAAIAVVAGEHRRLRRDRATRSGSAGASSASASRSARAAARSSTLVLRRGAMLFGDRRRDRPGCGRRERARARQPAVPRHGVRSRQLRRWQRPSCSSSRWPRAASRRAARPASIRPSLCERSDAVRVLLDPAARRLQYRHEDLASPSRRLCVRPYSRSRSTRSAAAARSRRACRSAFSGPSSATASRRSRACPAIRRSTTPARRRAASGRRPTAASAGCRCPISCRVAAIGALAVAPSDPDGRLGRHRRGVGDSRQRRDRRRHLQVDGRRQDLDAHGPRRDRPHRPHPRPPDESRHRVRLRNRTHHGAAAGARRLSHDRRRPALGARAVRRREHRLLRSVDGREEPAHASWPARGRSRCTRGRCSAAAPAAASTSRATAARSGRRSKPRACRNRRSGRSTSRSRRPTRIASTR